MKRVTNQEEYLNVIKEIKPNDIILFDEARIGCEKSRIALEMAKEFERIHKQYRKENLKGCLGCLL